MGRETLDFCEVKKSESVLCVLPDYIKFSLKFRHKWLLSHLPLHEGQ